MSEPLSPAAMAAVTVAAGRPVPRAVRHFGLAAMEARAARTRAANPPPASPSASQPASMSLGLVPTSPPAPPVVERPVRVRLWLPLTPLFVLLAPFALLLALLGYLVPPRLRPDPIFTALAIGRVLLALSGTDVDVRAPSAIVRIRIF